MKTFTIQEQCNCCDSWINVTFDSTFEEVESNYNQQLEIDGWLDGHCGACVYEYGNSLNEDYDEDEPEEDEDDN